MKIINFLAGLVGLILVIDMAGSAQAAIAPPRTLIAESGDMRTNMNLFWINPNDANLDHINVYFSTLPLQNFGRIAEVSGDNALPNQVGEYVIRNLSTSVDYYYIYLTAVDKAGSESVPTITLERRLGIVRDVYPTAPVSNVSINNITSSSVQLNWINPSDTDFYRTVIYRSKTSLVEINNTNLIGYKINLPSTADNFADNNLDSTTTYYYKLISEDVKSNLSDAVSVSATTLAQPIIPPLVPPIDTPRIVPLPPTTAPNNVPSARLFDYRASFVDQSGTVGLNSDNILTHIVNATRGSDIDMWIKFKNISSRQWWFVNPLDADSIHQIRLGLTKDATSPFVQNDWVSTNRITKISSNILPSEVATLNFKLHIPDNTAPGAYKLSVGLIAEWIKWMYDDVHWEIRVS
jgi:hypothetical protein